MNQGPINVITEAVAINRSINVLLILVKGLYNQSRKENAYCLLNRIKSIERLENVFIY